MNALPIFRKLVASRFSSLLAVTLTGCLLLPSSAYARPKIRQGLFLVYPDAESTRLGAGATISAKTDHCGACHYNFDGGGARNDYGVTIGDNLSNENQAIEYSNVVWMVRLIDSDEDGADNETEITASTNTYPNAPTFPGLTPLNLGLTDNVDRGAIEDRLVLSSGADNDPPEVAILQPNGGEVFVANTVTNIIWTAEDEGSGVAGVSIYLSLDNGTTYDAIAVGVASPDETNSHAWFPANRPSGDALIRIVAVDNDSNSTNAESAAVFTIASPVGGVVPTTLRDFDMPGTQPHEITAGLLPSTDCATCHGNYSTNHEPYFNWQGSMMAQASIDPLYQANQAIANQDAPDSGDLCLRCHLYTGWVQGRSVPTSGEAMLESDKFGVSCAVCHRMVDPVYDPGVSPVEDLAIITSLLNPGTNFGNGMVHLDPSDTRRGPFIDATNTQHPILVSPFHQEAAFCGTCHDVSNPAFDRNPDGSYSPNALDAPATDFSAHVLAPVERTYSEWLFSDFNTPSGVYLPEFAGNKTNGMVATCQDCHLRNIEGYGANTNVYAGVPLRQDLPLHDMTGGSTWLPMVLADMYPSMVDSNAAAAGVARATYLLQNAADLTVSDGANSQIQVTITNNCGHKLPTGYPEGRRLWLNVQFFDASTNLISESGAYNTNTAELSHDAEAKIYEIHPGIDSNLVSILHSLGQTNFQEGPSLHFVLNNTVFEDNRIPPRGFSNANFATFGGAPVGHEYADGQYWDDTLYSVPEGTKMADVKLYYQSTSKEFVEFLRDENVTNDKGDIMYDLWSTNGMCPPTLMQEASWLNPFLLAALEYTFEDHFRVDFHCRPAMQYTIEYTDSLDGSDTWHTFQDNGTQTPTGDMASFEDDFTSNTSGSAPVDGMRFYRFKYDGGD